MSEIAIEIVLDNMRKPVEEAYRRTHRIMLDRNAQHYRENGYSNDPDEYYGNYDLCKEVGEMIRDDLIKPWAKREHKLDIDDEITLTASLLSALLGTVDWNLVGEHYVQFTRERYGYRWQHE